MKLVKGGISNFSILIDSTVILSVYFALLCFTTATVTNKTFARESCSKTLKVCDSQKPPLRGVGPLLSMYRLDDRYCLLLCHPKYLIYSQPTFVFWNEIRNGMGLLHRPLRLSLICSVFVTVLDL